MLRYPIQEALVYMLESYEHRKSDIQFTNDKCMNATMRFLAVPAFAVLFEFAMN
jgi:hypothetical protein